MAGFITPLVALPAITARFGLSAWAAIAIGQSIGAASAVFVELGWGLNGPQRVARASRRYQRQYLALSLVTKSLALAPCCVISGAAAYLLAFDFRLEAALIAAGTTAGSLSSAWYYIGVRSSRRLLLADVVPKVGFVLLSAILIAQGGPLIIYPLLGMLAPAALITLLAILTERLDGPVLMRFSGPRVRQLMKLQGVALRARTVSSLYIALPVTLVSIANPQATAVFAGAERLQRLALQVLIAVPNFMQNWVGASPEVTVRRQRAQQSIWINAIIGFIAGGSYTLIAPIAAGFVFSGTISLSYELASLSGLLIFIICTSRATGGIALVSMRNIKAIARSSALGAAIGVPLIYYGGLLFGVFGALAAEIVAETVVLAYQLRAVRRKSSGYKGQTG